jgi:hypothetical protein
MSEITLRNFLFFLGTASKTIFGTPSMYRTEYNNIGSGKLVTIPDMKEKNF